MHQQQLHSSIVMNFAVAIALVAGTSLGSHAGEGEILICPMMHAKQMPTGFEVEAMKFTGPAGDGRRGSAGFVVQTEKLIKGPGTRFTFVFQRDGSGYGFQVIHPFGSGHVLITVYSGVTIHRGESWGDIGWGNPRTSDKVEMTEDAREILPLESGTPHQVVSQLSDSGDYRLWIDDKLICLHAIREAASLALEVPEDRRVSGGSSWDRTPFAGEDFEPKLKPGHAGLILGPMDGSGPRQCFRQITLSPVPADDDAAKPKHASRKSGKHFQPLFECIDNAREFGQLKRASAAGGSGGGSFEVLPVKPSVLVGFEYTTSTLYGGHLTIKSLRPIFRTRDGESVREWHGVPHGKAQRIKAKNGYVVAGIAAKTGHRVDGMRLICMRVEHGRLNSEDAYQSEWVGGRGGGAEMTYTANGCPIVGVYGRQGDDLDAIGFIQVEPRIVAHWRFQEGAVGGTSKSIKDSSGNDRHGRAIGGPKYCLVELPESNLALRFDGGDDRVFIPDDDLFHLTESFTIEAYIQIDRYARETVGMSHIVFRGDNRLGLDPWYLAITASGQLKFLVADAQNRASVILSPKPLPLGQLLHVAATLDHRTGCQALFVNGERVATIESKICVFGPLGGRWPGVGIGNRQTHSRQAFRGLIDEVRITAEALNPAQFLAPPTTADAVSIDRS